jgi:plasmid stabilization system protein ParE
LPKIIWTSEALADVQRLYRFLVSKDQDAARRAAMTIREGVQILSRHAHAGRPAADMPPEFREWPVSFGSGGYVVLYRVDGEDVAILAVRHGRQAGFG